MGKRRHQSRCCVLALIDSILETFGGFAPSLVRREVRVRSTGTTSVEAVQESRITLEPDLLGLTRPQAFRKEKP